MFESTNYIHYESVALSEWLFVNLRISANVQTRETTEVFEMLGTNAHRPRNLIIFILYSICKQCITYISVALCNILS